MDATRGDDELSQSSKSGCEHLQDPAAPPCADAPAEVNRPPFLTLRLPAYLPPGLNGAKGLQRMHWRAKTRAKVQLRLLLRSALGPPPHPSAKGPVRVLMVRTRTRGPAMDEDNAAASFKLLGDALQDLGVWADDRQITRLDVEQRTGTMKATEVIAWEI